MKTKRYILSFLLLGSLLMAATGCSSTQTNNHGVTIEHKRSGGLFSR